jgi:hypothetical protein
MYVHGGNEKMVYKTRTSAPPTIVMTAAVVVWTVHCWDTRIALLLLLLPPESPVLSGDWLLIGIGPLGEG